jgi:phosphoribosylcarboxyaminoimidazole (NCAIR) mutase
MLANEDSTLNQKLQDFRQKQQEAVFAMQLPPESD